MAYLDNAEENPEQSQSAKVTTTHFDNLPKNAQRAHPLHEAVRRTFSRIATDFRREAKRNPNFDHDVVVLWEEAIVEWVTMAGQTLDAVNMDDMGLASTIARSIQEKNRGNIRNISSRNACGNILRCAGGHLLELKADCKHAPSVGERCRVIRDLNLRTVPEDGEFLRGVGPTLESLEVKGRATSEFFQGLFKLPMRDVCLKLSSLSPAGASLDKAELLCSFSDQLHFATVRNFPKGRCHQVVEACPNTRTDGYIFHGVDGYSGAMSEGVSELAVLGSSLKALSFDVRCEIDVGELSEAARTCRNIEKIHVRTTAPFEVDVVKGILHHGKPFLREFSLNLERGNVLNASQELSNHAENLPFFGFVGAIQQRGVYESIVDNAPLLEKVHIEHACGRLDQPVENEDVDGNGQGGGIVALVAHVGDIVGTFVEYSQLRELKIRVGRNGFPRYG